MKRVPAIRVVVVPLCSFIVHAVFSEATTIIKTGEIEQKKVQKAIKDRDS